MLKRADKVLLATPYLPVVDNHFLCINSTCELLKVTDWAVQTLNKYLYLQLVHLDLTEVAMLFVAHWL